MKIKVAKSAGFCFGVKRAVELVEQQASLGKKVYTYGPIIHNEEVTEALLKKGYRLFREKRNGTRQKKVC